MITAKEQTLIQLLRDADDGGRIFIVKMLLCFAQCGEDFIRELEAVKGNRAEMEAVVDKYLPSLER